MQDRMFLTRNVPLYITPPSPPKGLTELLELAALPCTEGVAVGESLKFLTAILSQASKHPASPHLATLLDQTSSLAALLDPQLRAWLQGVLLGYPEGSSAHEPCGNPVQMCIWVEAYAQEEWYVARVCIGCLALCLYVYIYM